MKKTILFAILFLSSISSTLYAQNIQYNVESLAPSKLKKSKAKLFFIEKTKDGGLVVVREYLNPSQYTTKESYFFQHYDKNNNLINSVQIKHTKINDFWLEDDKLYYIENNKNTSQLQQNVTQRKPGVLQNKRKTDSYDIKLYEASLNDFIFKEKKILHELKRIGGENFDSFFFSDNLTTSKPYNIFSKKKRFTACIYETKTEQNIVSKGNDYELSKSVIPSEKEKTYSNVYKIVMFQKGQDKPLYTKNFILNHSINWTLSTSSFTINEEDGSLFFLESEDLDKKKVIDFRQGIPTTTNIIRIDSLGIKRVNINDITDKQFSKPHSFIFHKNKTYIINTYYSDSDKEKLVGLSKIQLSDQLETIENNSFPFSEDFFSDRIKILKANGKRKPEEKAYEFETIIDGSSFFDESDNLILNLSEAQYIVQSSTTAGFGFGGISIGVSEDTSYYKYISALIVKIGNNNKLLWSRCISVKSNIYDAFNGYSGGYHFLSNNNYNYILFEKQPKTNNSNHNDFAPVYTKTLIQIDDNGELQYDLNFLKPKENNSNSKTRSMYFNDNDRNIIYIDLGKSKRKTLTKLSF